MWFERNEPVWIRECNVKAHFCVKVFKQMSHWNGRSPNKFVWLILLTRFLLIKLLIVIVVTILVYSGNAFFFFYIYI